MEDGVITVKLPFVAILSAALGFSTPTLAQVAPASGQGNLAGARAEVPIHQTILKDGNVRYWIPVRIGNSRPVETMLDTGSAGLRILPDAVAADNYAATDRQNVYGYGSGVKITGVIADARVTVGGAAIEAPIPIQLIRSVGCYEKKPKCPASRLTLENYGLGGDGIPNQGFKAIIGIDTPPPGLKFAVVNPLMHMGGGVWIVIVPLPGQSEPGKLIINPDPKDLEGFTWFRHLVLVPPHKRGHLSACLHNENTGRAFCGPLVLDTGAPGIHLSSLLVKRQRVWPQGMQGSYQFGDATGRPLKMNFTVNRALPGSRVTIEPETGQYSDIIYAGILPYFSFAVLYDAPNNAMALRPRR